VQAYRAAARVDPQDGDAWNNLAQVLMEQGQYAQALQAAQRAVATGGSRLAQYRALEQNIREKVPLGQ
jgi:Tfp pilus assembly protein PilF